MVTSTFSNRVNATTDPFINRRKQPPLQLNIHQNNRSGGSSSSNNNNISRVDSTSKRIDKNAISKRDYDHSSLLARAMSGKSILKLIDDMDDELKERNEKLRALLRIDDSDNNDDDDNNSTTFKIVDNSRQSSPEAIIQIPTINITKVPDINHEDQEIILAELVAEIAATEPVNDGSRNSFRSTSSFISYNGSGNNLPSTPSFGPPKRIQSSLRIQVNINDTDSQLSSTPTSLTPRTNTFNADKSKNK
nr:11797_t:CDS:2 [Entrophospora candida]